MAPTSPEGDSNTDTRPGKEQDKPAQTTDHAGANDTLKIPLWFITIFLLLMSFRVYAKLTQSEAPPGKGVAWITLEQFNKSTRPGDNGKDLVLYEFTADWCPPCKKRERTTFRAPKIINEINSHFIPVRIDLTKRSDGERPDVKQLTEKFNVGTIPRCVITLRSGEWVQDDHYLFSTEFIDFLETAIKEASTVHAELDLSKGDYAGAMAQLSPELIKGRAVPSAYAAADYLMCHHLLLVLNRKADLESMMQQTCEKTRTEKRTPGEDTESIKWLDQLNGYLRGQITDDQLIEKAHLNADKAADYLAIGLKHLRQGDKEKAVKALHQSSIFSAKSYQSDRLAEFMVKELDK